MATILCPARAHNWAPARRASRRGSTHSPFFPVRPVPRRTHGDQPCRIARSTIRACFSPGPTTRQGRGACQSGHHIPASAAVSLPDPGGYPDGPCERHRPRYRRHSPREPHRVPGRIYSAGVFSRQRSRRRLRRAAPLPHATTCRGSVRPVSYIRRTHPLHGKWTGSHRIDRLHSPSPDVKPIGSAGRYPRRERPFESRRTTCSGSATATCPTRKQPAAPDSRRHGGSSSVRSKSSS